MAARRSRGVVSGTKQTGRTPGRRRGAGRGGWTRTAAAGPAFGGRGGRWPCESPSADGRQEVDLAVGIDGLGEAEAGDFGADDDHQAGAQLVAVAEAGLEAGVTPL